MDLNFQLAELLIKGNSLRDCARLLKMTYKNTYRKFQWLIEQARVAKYNIPWKAEVLQFDEMETIHHTKCKPLSIALMVNEKYEILAAQVAEMPAKGRLAEISRIKYGPRFDAREIVLENCFKTAKKSLCETPETIMSDARPTYRKFVEQYFAESSYEIHSRADKERHRSRLHEKLQKKRFDPMFAINQRCAKLRSSIRRLARRSWCTTKKVENLQGHLDLFIVMQFGLL